MDLQKAMSLAREFERRAATPAVPASSCYHKAVSTRPALPAPATTTPLTTATPPAGNIATAPPPPRLLRRLSPSEMAERRRQGLCYNCDEQYTHGHKSPRLFYLEVTDSDDDNVEDPDNDQQPAEQPPLISLHAITGI